MEKYGFKGMEKISDNADREIFGRLPARCQSFIQQGIVIPCSQPLGTSRRCGSGKFISKPSSTEEWEVVSLGVGYTT